MVSARSKSGSFSFRLLRMLQVWSNELCVHEEPGHPTSPHVSTFLSGFERLKMQYFRHLSYSVTIICHPQSRSRSVFEIKLISTKFREPSFLHCTVTIKSGQCFTKPNLVLPFSWSKSTEYEDSVIFNPTFLFDNKDRREQWLVMSMKKTYQL